jgi:sulfur carrier protein ThiS
MNSIAIRFYAELNDFLPSDKKQVAFRHYFSSQTTIKALIEALGVPQTEVDLILVNGDSVPCSKLIQGGETVAVYPKFKTIDITPVRPEPLSEYHD